MHLSIGLTVMHIENWVFQHHVNSMPIQIFLKIVLKLSAVICLQEVLMFGKSNII